MQSTKHTTQLNLQTLSSRWQTARRICANVMAWLNSEIHAPPHVCYHVEHGHSALKGVGTNTWEPQNLGVLELLSWDGMRVWPQDAHPSITCDEAIGPRKNFDNIFSYLDTKHERDRQTPAGSKDRAHT